MKYLPGFILLLASWLQPLHILPWVSWHSEVLAFAALAWFFSVELFIRIKSRQAFVVVPRVAMAPLALGLAVMIQFGAGQIQFFGDALILSVYLACCAMVIGVGRAWGEHDALAQTTSDSQPLLGQLAVIVLIGAAASVLIALVQVFNVWGEADWISRIDGFRRPNSNIGQPNNFATLLLMGIASLAFLLEAKRLSTTLAVILLVLLTLGIAMSESRTGLLSAMVLTAWWFHKRQIFKRKGAVALVATGWVSLLFLVWAWPLFITFSQHGEGLAQINVSAGGRLVAWPQLLEAVMQRPWFGWGLREVSEAHNAVLSHYASGEPFTYAHNIVLDLAIGLGLPMTALILGLFAYWAWRRLKAVDASATWYCIALAIPLAVHSMLEFPFSYVYFLVPVLLAVGVLEAATAPRSIVRLRTSFTTLGAASLFLLMIWSAVEYVAIEEDFRVARFEALRVGQTPSDYNRPKVHLLTQLDVMLAASRMVPLPEMSPTDIELLRSAAMRFPWTAIQNRYALSLALNGNPDEAIRQLRVMRAMHGEKHYQALKANWELLASDKYPQLGQLKLP
jgi:O-antigen ligase